MKTWTIRLLVISALAVVAGAVSRPAAAAPASASVGQGGFATVLREAMSTERREADAAAASGSYRTATEHFRKLRNLLDQERQFLEDLSGRLPATDEGVRIRAALEQNRSEDAEVSNMLSLLRVAVTSSR